jgi:sugar transferase (PEP-CTERM system associated)
LASTFSPYDVKGFLDDDPGKHGIVVEGLEVLGSLDRLGEMAGTLGIKTAILAITNNRSRRLTRRVLESRLQGLEIVEMPTVYERLIGRIPVQHIEDQWLLLSEGFFLLSKDYVQKWKRMGDFVISSLLLIFTAPLMAITALAIRLESPGPVFYQQDRVGKNDKVFTVNKFRSMRVDAEAHGARWAQKMDPRVTRVGRWIRMFRIDELPQMWNAFVGDMSLVGPRPERPEFVSELEAKIPYYGIRHTVAPGITGWAQVKYPYGASFEDALRKLEYDVYYIKNMSILLDLKILLRTVGVVLLGEGAR